MRLLSVRRVSVPRYLLVRKDSSIFGQVSWRQCLGCHLDRRHAGDGLECSAARMQSTRAVMQWRTPWLLTAKVMRSRSMVGSAGGAADRGAKPASLRS